jgi:FtsH-binding integral membrane protein
MLALNLILLGTFTLMESFTIGVAISFFDQQVVLQALLV